LFKKKGSKFHPSSIHEFVVKRVNGSCGAPVVSCVNESSSVGFSPPIFSCPTPPRNPRSVDGSAFVDNREGKKEEEEEEEESQRKGSAAAADAPHRRRFSLEFCR
jgi:hypothetical protein